MYKFKYLLRFYKFILNFSFYLIYLLLIQTKKIEFK